MKSNDVSARTGVVISMKTLTDICSKLVTALRDVRARLPLDGADKVQYVQEVLDRADRVVDDSKMFLEARKKVMTFREFFDSHFATASAWCVITIKHPNLAACSAIVLQWEPSNYKWYRPNPIEGREECGSYDSIGPIPEYGGIKGEVEGIRVLVSDIV